MKQISLTERQMTVLMNVGRAVNDALPEFRGRTPADIATAAYSSFTAMLGLQVPSPGMPATPAVKPVRRKKRKSPKKAGAKAAAKTVTKESTERTVRIMSVLGRAKEPLPASGIAEKLGISGQGLGPVLNKMHSDGAITKKEVDGSFVWGPKSGRHLNGKAAHASN